jgi:hypothetical protein
MLGLGFIGLYVRKHMTHLTDRRAFLSFTATGLASSVAVPSLLTAQPGDLEAWLTGLNGRHKQFFDVGAIAEARPLKRTGNFLASYRSAYSIDEKEINVLFGAHGDGLAFVLGDSLWQRLKLGEWYGLRDKSGAFPTANPFLGEGGIFGLSAADSVTGLMKRGTRFLACMNTVGSLARSLAASGYGVEASLRDQILGGLVPGAMPVPGMLVAANRAQEAQFQYAYLS